MADPIILNEDYLYNQYKISGAAGTVIDASGAHWILSNMGEQVNRYPVLVEDSDGVVLTGGTITGQVPLDTERVDTYINSAAIFVQDADDAVISDWRISKVWDGIRVRGSENFTIEDVWISDVRDDAIENDDGLSGTVRDSLFDGVFVGISTSDASSGQSAGLVTFDDVLIRMESYLDHGILTHQSPFKVTSKSPNMEIHDSIIAIEDVDHIGQARLAEAWKKTVAASGNYFLNLSDDPLPKGYPMPPKGFTVLQGAEARAFWETKKAAWISAHSGEPVEVELVQTEGDAGDNVLNGDAKDNTLSGYQGNDTLKGQGGDDLLIGHEGNDVLRGQDGNDSLAGRFGRDVLIGGDGDDVLRFAKLEESPSDAPDILRAGDGAVAFEGAGVAGGDVIDLRGLDADEVTSGNQSFKFGVVGRGGISLVDLEDGSTLVRANTDRDAAFEFALVIEDSSVKAAHYIAGDFIL